MEVCDVAQRLGHDLDVWVVVEEVVLRADDDGGDAGELQSFEVLSVVGKCMR